MEKSSFTRSFSATRDRGSSVGRGVGGDFLSPGDGVGIDGFHSPNVSGTAQQHSFGATATSPSLSPTRRTRVQEKQQLSNLNDRLASYIDKVRFLEGENQRLASHVRLLEDSAETRRGNIKGAFEKELADARRVLDETAKERESLRLELSKYKAQVAELLPKNLQLQTDLNESESKRIELEKAHHDYVGKFNLVNAQHDRMQDELNKMRRDFDDLKADRDNLQTALTDETLQRVDTANRLQSLKEQSTFDKQLYEQELAELRTKKQSELRDMNSALEGEYQQKLADTLKEMRERLNLQLAANREEIEAKYEGKMKDLDNAFQRAQDEAVRARDDAKRFRSSLEVLEKEQTKHVDQVRQLEAKIRDLDEELRGIQDGWIGRLAERDGEIRRLQAEIADMIQDYQDLMDTKIQLDVEINAYRQLLEGEEHRLNLTPTEITLPTEESPFVEGVRKRGAKRRRVDLDEPQLIEETTDLSTGALQIETSAADGGKSVTLVNTSDEKINIGGWILRRTAGDKSTDFPFAKGIAIKPGAEHKMTIYSANSGAVHKPPGSVVMKKKNWPKGDVVRCVLLDSDKKEIAWRETKRTESMHMNGTANGGTTAFGENGYGIQVPENDDDGRGCIIM